MLNTKWKVYALDMCLEDWLDGQTDQLFDALEEAPPGCEDGVFEGFESYPRPEFACLSKHALAALIIHMAYTAQCCERRKD